MSDIKTKEQAIKRAKELRGVVRPFLVVDHMMIIMTLVQTESMTMEPTDFIVDDTSQFFIDVEDAYSKNPEGVKEVFEGKLVIDGDESHIHTLTADAEYIRHEVKQYLIETDLELTENDGDKVSFELLMLD